MHCRGPEETADCGAGNFPLLNEVRNTILAWKPPGIWRMSVKILAHQMRAIAAGTWMPGWLRSIATKRDRTTILSPFRVTICGIPELGEHSGAGVTHVLSILDPDYPDIVAFAAFAPHHRLLLRFNDIIEPEPDRQAPTRVDVQRVLDFARALGETANLLIHCHAGVSRSTASAALILAQAEPTRRAKDIFAAIVSIRPYAWPNLRILEFGDAILGRNGEIVAAASKVYRDALDRKPYLREAMIDGSRSREVIAALRR
jgi:predicted protein tyrosine phosphatase